MLLAQMEQPSRVLDMILPAIPWLIILVVMWIVIYRKLRSESATAQQANERTDARWSAMESKLDRIIALLERRDREKE